jgi:thiamine pyrophosphokinase
MPAEGFIPVLNESPLTPERGDFFMVAKRAWIFVNGNLADAAAVKAMIQPGDLLIAADGGLRHLRLLGLQPDAVIGDFDSISNGDYQRLLAEDVHVEKHPPAKDETDLELALLWALNKGARHIRIAAAQGNRFDHTMGNLFLLLLPELEGCDVRLENGRDVVFLIRDQGRVEGLPGDRVSLLPLGGPATGVTTRGLQYALSAETLWPERTRGISNVLVESSAEIIVASGVLICIHTRRNQPGSIS